MDTGAEDREPVAISALQHAVYCLRQAALIHLEQQWAENRLTAEGRVAHEATALPGVRTTRGVRRVQALPLASARLGVSGVADFVEFRKHPGGETAYPVEIKRGRPKLHRADEVQLCAQALCLEEMTGQPVPEGALFYLETRRRVAVPIDDALRALTLETIDAMRALVESGRTPPAIYKADRCRACSLIEICRPKIASRSVCNWRDKRLASILADAIEDAP
jgi:CRISPR-associated exonuclease Cas4